MKRRSFFKATGLLTTALSFGWRAFAKISFQNKSTVKTLLRGGRGFYQGKWQILDVGIDENGKLRIAPPNSIQAPETIEINNKIVSPGFIDILSDNASNPQKTYKIVEKYKVTDGVTTA